MQGYVGGPGVKQQPGLNLPAFIREQNRDDHMVIYYGNRSFIL